MKLVILDRDGVINQDSKDHIRHPDQWVPIPGSLEAIARLRRADYRVVVISNQSGVGRGFFTLDTLLKINARMLEHVSQKGGEIDAILFCPHTPKAVCPCRKPKAGLFLELAERLKVNLVDVPAVGDSRRDLEASIAAGCRPILVRTGNGTGTERTILEEPDGPLAGVSVYDDLLSYVEDLLLDEARASMTRR